MPVDRGRDARPEHEAFLDVVVSNRRQPVSRLAPAGAPGTDRCSRHGNLGCARGIGCALGHRAFARLAARTSGRVKEVTAPGMVRGLAAPAVRRLRSETAGGSRSVAVR